MYVVQIYTEAGWQTYCDDRGNIIRFADLDFAELYFNDKAEYNKLCYRAIDERDIDNEEAF